MHTSACTISRERSGEKRVLLGIELQMDPEAIAEKAQVPLEQVRHVQALVTSSVHKRKTPLIPKVGIRTVGLDWRE